MALIATAGDTFTFTLALADSGTAGKFLAAPAIVAGDFQRSINGGALANLTNLPTVSPAGSKIVQVIISAAETTAAGQDGLISIIASDPDNTWDDVFAEVRIVATANDVAMTGADGDTLETLSDQIDAITTCCASVLAIVINLVSNIVTALMSQAAIAKALRTVDLTLYRGDTWSQVITGMGDLTGYTDIWFAAKTDPDDTDNEAIFLISESVGLERINGAAAAAPANGSITVLDLAGGIIQVDLDEVETAKLVPDKRFWDAQKLVTGTVTTPRAGRLVVSADIVRATS